MSTLARKIVECNKILGFGQIWEMSATGIQGAAQDSSNNVFVGWSDNVVAKYDLAGTELAQKSITGTGQATRTGLGVQPGTDDIIVHGGTSARANVVAVENDLTTTSWASEMYRGVNPTTSYNYGGFIGPSQDNIPVGAYIGGTPSAYGRLTSTGGSMPYQGYVALVTNSVGGFMGYNAHGYDYLTTPHGGVIYTIRDDTAYTVIASGRLSNASSGMHFFADSTHVYFANAYTPGKEVEIYKYTAPISGVWNKIYRLTDLDQLTSVVILQPSYKSDDMYIAITNSTDTPDKIYLAKLNADGTLDADQLRIEHSTDDLAIHSYGNANATMPQGSKMVVGSGKWVWLIDKELDMSKDYSGGDITVTSGTYIEEGGTSTVYLTGLTHSNGLLSLAGSTPASAAAASKTLTTVNSIT